MVGCLSERVDYPGQAQAALLRSVRARTCTYMGLSFARPSRRSSGLPDQLRARGHVPAAFIVF